MAKPDREVRKKTRDAALKLLAPRYLAAAEDVGVTANEWLKRKREANEAAAKYQEAWAGAQRCGWSSEELAQLVEERPPRKAASSATSSGGPAASSARREATSGPAPSSGSDAPDARADHSAYSSSA